MLIIIVWSKAHLEVIKDDKNTLLGVLYIHFL